MHMLGCSCPARACRKSGRRGHGGRSGIVRCRSGGRGRPRVVAAPLGKGLACGRLRCPVAPSLCFFAKPASESHVEFGPATQSCRMMLASPRSLALLLRWRCAVQAALAKWAGGKRCWRQMHRYSGRRSGPGGLRWSRHVGSAGQRYFIFVCHACPDGAVIDILSTYNCERPEVN